MMQMTLTHNPYQVIVEADPPPKSDSHPLTLLTLMLPFALAAAYTAGSSLVVPGGVQIFGGHPMVPSGIIFGLAAGLQHVLCVLLARQIRRHWWKLAIPIVLPILLGFVFEVTGRMLEAAARWMTSDPGLSTFLIGLLGSGLVGMSLLTACLVLLRMLPLRSAVPFTLITSTLGAVCVSVVNSRQFIRTPVDGLFWTMFLWQFTTLMYFAFQSTRTKPDRQSPPGEIS